MVKEFRTENESYYIGLDAITKDVKFDFVSIDGPIGYTVKHPRTNILSIIDNNQLNDKFFILLHDADRSGEQWLFKEICESLPKCGYNKFYCKNISQDTILIVNDI